MTNNPYHSYFSEKEQSKESPALYVSRQLEIAANHIRQAAQAIQNQQIETRYHESQKATDILTNLAEVLDYETPECQEMTGILEIFYLSVISKITYLNIHNDLSTCYFVIQSLEKMAMTWREVHHHFTKNLSSQEPNSSAETYPRIS